MCLWLLSYNLRGKWIPYKVNLLWLRKGTSCFELLLLLFVLSICHVSHRAEVLEEERKAAVGEKNNQLQELQNKLELTINNLKHQLTVQQSQVKAETVNTT